MLMNDTIFMSEITLMTSGKKSSFWGFFYPKKILEIRIKTIKFRKNVLKTIGRLSILNSIQSRGGIYLVHKDECGRKEYIYKRFFIIIEVPFTPILSIG